MIRDTTFINVASEQTKDVILDAIELLNFTKEIISKCPTCAQKMRDRK